MRHICSLLVSLTSSLLQGSPASWMYFWLGRLGSAGRVAGVVEGAM